MTETDASTLAALFDHMSALGGGVEELVGGQALFRAGEPSDRLHLLKSGRLAASRVGPTGVRRTIGLVRAGEVVGEMSLLAGTAHSADVMALRDSVVAWIPASAFLAEARRNPVLMGEAARLMLRRNRGANADGVGARAILLAAIHAGLDPLPMAYALADGCRALGFSAIVLAADARRAGGSWLAAAEDEHDFVLLAARLDEEDWTENCRRQVDRVLLVGRGTEGPPIDCSLCESEPLQASRLVDLVLAWPHDGPYAGSEAWLDATHAGRIFHAADPNARPGPAYGIDRLARVVTGTSVGLVLSGGGARAFAHVGVVRALREAGIPIDFVGGTSMGAIIAAGVAIGWTDDELDDHMRRAFVVSNPMDDIALPLIAMTRGRKVEHRLAEHFGDAAFADLRIPCFCVSASLTTGAHHRHERGSVADALRASIALPGILPPVIIDGQVLVDGGILRNLPTDLMRLVHDGTIVGSDVTRSIGLDAQDVMAPRSWLRWLWSGAWRGGPPIVSILIRSATIATGPEHALAQAAADLYIMPELGMVEIRDWLAYDEAVEAGYRAAQAALAALDGPLTHHRRRLAAAAAERDAS